MKNRLRILDDINEQIFPATLKGQGVETFDAVLKDAERLKYYGMDRDPEGGRTRRFRRHPC